MIASPQFTETGHSNDSIYGIFLLPTFESMYVPLYYQPYYSETSPSSENLSKDYNQKFHSKTQHNIVLSQESSLQIAKTATVTFQLQCQFKPLKEKKVKTVKKQKKEKGKDYSQKQDRNTCSNLLRIFLKNVLQLEIYTNLIENISNKFNLDLSVRNFYDWLWSFNINFKNYIRFKQVLKIFSRQDELEKPFHIILMLLLRGYLENYGFQHCLTSRKISENGRKMHLEGLRLIKRQLFSLRNRDL